MADTLYVVPVFGPALLHTDYVIEYVFKVKNNKARNTMDFKDVFEILANPALLADAEIWSIILDIIRNFDFYFADIPKNPLWKIFYENDDIVKKLTGFMLSCSKSQLSNSMLSVSLLPSVPYVTTAPAELLSRILKWVWVPVIVRLKKSKSSHFEIVSSEDFNKFSSNMIYLDSKRSLDVYNVKREFRGTLLYKNQLIKSNFLRSDWSGNLVQSYEYANKFNSLN